jgi:uroporphyrin-III C-methyltransferase/precorrin-2 dehydrogenase/sirohydrochlorin ferrochelatase
VQSSGLSPSGQRRFWRAFAAFAVGNPQREPAPSDFDALLRTTEDQATVAEAGSITLVGAGQGDAELLTMRAVRALQSADVILIDDLLAPDSLDFARREAKMALLGKTGRLRQDEVTLMIALAKAGRRVVRLEGGGSPMFGRAEIAACRRAGIAVEVVPGVTGGGAPGETERNKANRLSDRAKNSGRLAPIPGTPLRACCGWPAVRRARRARALRSTSRG